MYLKLGRGLESDRAVARSPVGAVVHLRAEECSTGRGGGVVLRLVVGCSVKHRASSEATASNLHGLVVPWDQFGVETINRNGHNQIIRFALTQ